MKGCLFSVIKLIILILNILLINFIPSTDSEFKVFCASRLVLILMILVDYIGVFINNKGVEKLIGGIGIFVSTCLIACEILIYSSLVIPGEDYTYIIGSEKNYFTQLIPSIPLSMYLMFVFGSILAVLGLEIANQGIRSVPSTLKELNDKVGDESADSK